jgi:hypothetical protein
MREGEEEEARKRARAKKLARGLQGHSRKVPLYFMQLEAVIYVLLGFTLKT